MFVEILCLKLILDPSLIIANLHHMTHMILNYDIKHPVRCADHFGIWFVTVACTYRKKV